MLFDSNSKKVSKDLINDRLKALSDSYPDAPLQLWPMPDHSTLIWSVGDGTPTAAVMVKGHKIVQNTPKVIEDKDNKNKPK